MGEKYYAKIKEDFYGGSETIFIGHACSDGKFRFYADYRLGRDVSPFRAWCGFISKENAQITDANHNPLTHEEFLSKMQTLSVSDDFLMIGLH